MDVRRKKKTLIKKQTYFARYLLGWMFKGTCWSVYVPWEFVLFYDGNHMIVTLQILGAHD